MSFLVQFLTAAVVGLLTPVFLSWMLKAAQKPVEEDGGGWIRLHPTAASVALGLMGLPLMIFLALLLSAVAVLSGELVQEAFLLLIVIMFMYLSGLYIYAIFIVRTKFNHQRIQYRGIAKNIEIDWEDVHKVSESKLLGQFASTRKGRLIISNVLRGFPQFIEEAQRHQIEVKQTLIRNG